MENKRTQELFQKYFNKTATEKEVDELMLRIDDTISDEGLSDLIDETYQTFIPSQDPFSQGTREKMLLQIQAGIALEEQVEKPARLSKYTWLKYASVALLLICTSLAIVFFNHENRSQYAAKIDFKPGGNKAILTLGNGSKISLDDAKNGDLARQGNVNIEKNKDGEINYDVSKTAGNETETNVAYNTITTPKGGQYQVVLADGTKVWLNSVSSISFPTLFYGKERRVEVTGEVYFEVAKSKTKPFIVKAANQLVEVLGTHFNINSYSDEPDVKTTLLEGSVQIRQLNHNSSALLKPGQQAVNNPSGPMLVKNVDVEQAVAWKNGMFQINDADIATIMRQAARWYDVDIQYDGKIPQRQFSGKIKRDVKASEFLQMLSYFDVHFIIDGRKIIVKNN